MKGTTALAIGICIFCFFIGYLTFLGSMLIVDFLKERVNPCLTENCSPLETAPRRH